MVDKVHPLQNVNQSRSKAGVELSAMEIVLSAVEVVLSAVEVVLSAVEVGFLTSIKKVIISEKATACFRI